ncbi:outer membrane beta-barrel protein [Methylocapsa polymorpha]|uniref:Outer membrane beta-barrel protein n=1 Tax=Methylocapsa polymorpha TaxID=3080828 RepID=A0ABZ0HP96_9HYPH|nr:outer membrane beta-barrel protein [Methylocapsa sp. RX1]
MASTDRFCALLSLCAAALFLDAGLYAHAADVAAKPAAPPPAWIDTLTVSGAVEAGETFNPAYPPNGLNFGQLFTDKSNLALLNQALLTIQRPLDPNATGYDFGFKVQTMYGSDARYTHFLGELDYIIPNRTQFDVVEAYGVVHLPWLYKGGVDVKFGQYVTLEGAEVISASDNLLYSHSYIFNFGVPLKHTGVMTISHIDPLVDIYAGVDSGVNTSVGWPGDNNRGVAFHGGVGLNLLDGNFTILATTHIGPENPDVPAVIAGCACNPNRALRYLDDVTTTWKVTDKLTLINDINYIHDNAFHASGYGVAQYAAYAITDWLKIVGRAEVWRDAEGFFVAAYPGNFDFVNVEHGFNFLNLGGGSFFSYGFISAPAPTTYLELTAGLNITPTLPADPALPLIKALIVRPEIRYDASLSHTTPFDAGRKASQFTFAGDIIVKF